MACPTGASARRIAGASRGLARGAALGAIAAAVLALTLPTSTPARGDDAAPPPAAGAGNAMESCGACHAREIAATAATVHRGMATAAGFGAASLSLPQVCETCHGPIAAHGPGSEPGIPAPWVTRKTASEKSAPCLTCHTSSLTQHWAGSVHEGRDVGCTDCHRMHPEGRPQAGLPAKFDEVETCVTCHLTVKASVWRASRHPVREGRMVCSGCHNPHGTQADAQLVRATVNETCLSCHAEKRGPFLWTHPPVAENCLTCHVAHGGINDHLLVMKPPRLCQSCHSEPDHVGVPHNTIHHTGSPDRFTFNKGCADCHQVHGSNSPSGATLLR